MGNTKFDAGIHRRGTIIKSRQKYSRIKIGEIFTQILLMSNFSEKPRYTAQIRENFSKIYSQISQAYQFFLEKHNWGNGEKNKRN